MNERRIEWLEKYGDYIGDDAIPPYPEEEKVSGRGTAVWIEDIGGATFTKQQILDLQKHLKFEAKKPAWCAMTATPWAESEEYKARNFGSGTRGMHWPGKDKNQTPRRARK